MDKTLTIRDVADYIIKHYPEKHYAYRLEVGASCDDNDLAHQCCEFFYYEILNWCGCGSPEDAQLCIRDYLYSLSDLQTKQEHLKQLFGVEYVYDNKPLLCLAYMLDALGFTEHGGSVGGAWLTDVGRMFLLCLQNNQELTDEEEMNT